MIKQYMLIFRFKRSCMIIFFILIILLISLWSFITIFLWLCFTILSFSKSHITWMDLFLLNALSKWGFYCRIILRLWSYTSISDILISKLSLIQRFNLLLLESVISCLCAVPITTIFHFHRWTTKIFFFILYFLQ